MEKYNNKIERVKNTIDLIKSRSSNESRVSYPNAFDVDSLNDKVDFIIRYSDFFQDKDLSFEVLKLIPLIFDRDKNDEIYKQNSDGVSQYDKLVNYTSAKLNAGKPLDNEKGVIALNYLKDRGLISSNISKIKHVFKSSKDAEAKSSSAILLINYLNNPNWVFDALSKEQNDVIYKALVESKFQSPNYFNLMFNFIGKNYKNKEDDERFPKIKLINNINHEINDNIVGKVFDKLLDLINESNDVELTKAAFKKMSDIIPKHIDDSTLLKLIKMSDIEIDKSNDLTVLKSTYSINLILNNSLLNINDKVLSKIRANLMNPDYFSSYLKSNIDLYEGKIIIDQKDNNPSIHYNKLNSDLEYISFNFNYFDENGKREAIKRYYKDVDKLIYEGNRINKINEYSSSLFNLDKDPNDYFKKLHKSFLKNTNKDRYMQMLRDTLESIPKK